MRNSRLVAFALILGSTILGLSCSGGDSHSEPKKTYIQVQLDYTSCNGQLAGPISGTLTAVSANWQSNSISLSAGDSVKVEIPDGGAYRVHFTSYTGLWYWDFTVNATAGGTTPAKMTCS